jgi:hypothetical protein
MLRILIPSSLTMESKDWKIKTYKVGQIARIASIFRVDEILIYKDREWDESDFISVILRYAETPQYLRKTLFPLSKELRYVGTIPPLRTEHHPLPGEIKIGEIRDGIFDGEKVDIGAKNFAKMKMKMRKKVKKGRRMSFRVLSIHPLMVEPAEPEGYRGYKVKICGSLGSTLKKLDSTIIFTSRYGESITKKMEDIRRKNVTFVFGSPTRGVREILEDEGLSPENFSPLIINMVPEQGTATVRVEEALIATLSIYNMVRW